MIAWGHSKHGRGGGSGGRGGTGGNPCTMYPSARAFTPPTDTRVHCYWARTSSQTWSEAQQSCNLQNGYLVSILSAEENAFVVSMAAFSSSFNDTWIGATDTKSGGDRTGAGTYRWVSNEPWGYTSWSRPYRSWGWSRPYRAWGWRGYRSWGWRRGGWRRW